MTQPSPDPEQLARYLDRVLPAGTAFIPPPTNEPLVNVAAQIARIKVAPIAAEVSERIEARMLEVFTATIPTKPVALVPRRASVMLRWAATIALIFVLFLGGTTALSASSVPGEALYPVKRAVESLEITFATSSQQQISVYLTHAQRRAEEALLLTARNQTPQDVLAAAHEDLRRAQSVDPALTTDQAFQSRLAEINHLLSLIEAVVPDGSAPDMTEEPGIIPSGGAAAETTAPMQTGSVTPTATASLSVTPTPTTTLTPSASASPTLQQTPSPTRTPTVAATRTPSPTSRRQNPTRAVESGVVATDCPGNSCDARGTHQPTDRGGGNDNGGGNGNSGGGQGQGGGG